ncbi:MAG TPA: hypothetical protein VIM81_11560 [Gammaproteobacteria bacterium]
MARVWFSDIVNNAVGWFDPESGESGIYPVPKVPGREGGEALYGLVMTSDRTHVWYAQLGIGSFGSLNVDTLEFETSVQLPDKDSGPRRITVSDDDVLYVPLYGAGQLVEYDTRARRMIGVYDLPDRASAPYAVTWDSKRKVLWIPTSNADAIYRFDPRDKSFAVLPLPREGAFLRQLLVDSETGALVTSYANIVENVHGPRMALMIDLGDGARRGRRSHVARREALQRVSRREQNVDRPTLRRHCDATPRRQGRDGRGARAQDRAGRRRMGCSADGAERPRDARGSARHGTLDPRDQAHGLNHAHSWASSRADRRSGDWRSDRPMHLHYRNEPDRACTAPPCGHRLAFPS